MIVPLSSKIKHLNMETNEIATKQRNSCSKTMIEMVEQGMKFKINTRDSSVSVCNFEQVNLCIFHVT